ncbi:MAG: flagellar biosynthetic protein FliR, partial [Rubripirellula sp.]|nr:flagellar biosynthetic protein FliR [Rubripirellula sp.]
LLDSYHGMPVGAVGLNSDILELLVNQLSRGVVAGIKLAGPVVTLVVLSNVLTGVISRTLPQINILAVGLSLNMLGVLVGLALALGSAGWLFQSELTRAAAGLSEIW